MSGFHWNQSFISEISSLLEIHKIFMGYQAAISRGTPTSPVKRLVPFQVISTYDYVLQVLKKLELHKKQGSETVHKYSHQNLFEIICRLPTPTTKSMFTTETSLNYCSIYKINTRGLIYLEMPFCSPKHLYFDTITCPNLKKVKRFQTEKLDGFFSEILITTNVGLIEKGCYSQEECWFVFGNCRIWKLIEYAKDHSPDEPIILTFQ